MKRFVATVALCSAWATPIQAVDSGCTTLEEANRIKQETGEEIVGQRTDPRLPGIALFLVMRADGTFKEVGVDPTGQVCHLRDFVGDPRMKRMSL